MNEQNMDGGSVRLERLVVRVRELARAVTLGRDAVAREMTMRVPAEPDRDADLVLSAVADELERLTRIEKAARDLDGAMTPHRDEILRGWNEREWSWAWDALALALTPPEEDPGACRHGIHMTLACGSCVPPRGTMVAHNAEVNATTGRERSHDETSK